MNNNINLTDLDLMAMFRVAQEIAKTDGDITTSEAEVFIKYAAPLNMSQGRMDRFINSAMKMDLEDAFDTLKELDPELKQYASNFFAEVALADGDVSDEENDIYANVMETCDLPFTTIGQDSNNTATESKYSQRELCAINAAFLKVWDATDAGQEVKTAFWERYDVFGEDVTTQDMSSDEAESVLYAMSDEKKEEVSKLLLDVIVAKDPGDTVFCDVANIEEYYDLVVRTGLPDLLTDHVLDYKNEEDEDDCGETPKGLSFTLQDLYTVWSIVNPYFTYCALSYPIDIFFDDFYVNDDFFTKLQEDNYLKDLGFCGISRLGTGEKDHISTILAETISVNFDDEDICILLSRYKALVDDYGLPDSLADFLDGHGISEYRTDDKQAFIRKVEIEPDLFVDGLSQTKIKVSLEVEGCKDGELRLIASVYHADDDSPVPDPDFMHYGNYSWDYDDVDVLSKWMTLEPSYNDSIYEDLEMYLPNDFLPHDRDYYIKVWVFDIDDQAFISYPFHTQQYSFKATKNEYDPAQITIEPTYIVVSYYEKDRKKIPGDYRDYRPCTISFEQIGLLSSYDDLKKKLGAEQLLSQNDTPKLDQISEKLHLELPGVDNELKLCIMYDENGAHGYNKLRDLAGLGCNNDTFYETLVVCLQNKESDGTVYGFKYVSQLREVLKALDEAVYGLAYNGPVYDQPAFAKSFESRFWQQVETEISKLNYEFVKLSERATAINPKNEKAKGAYHVVLKSAGAKKLVVIKLIQEILRCDLNKAKHLADTALETVKACENEDEAYALKAKLEAAGAEAEVIFYYYIDD